MTLSVYTLTDDERAWLKSLQEDLWPKAFKTPRTHLEARRVLTMREFKRVLELIKTRHLVTNMICTNMFGGYGMDVYEHEPFPDTGPVFLLRLVEDHHPIPHPIDVAEGATKHIRRPGGVGRDDAWESFSRFTHSAKNRKWLKSYGIESPQERSHYDY